MLADQLVEEFEMKEDEPWYDHRDLQQDLQLAAELGKTLLDRNTELEDSLQQMYTTNQEQLQEIEYLSKQVELLRQMNEQHAKVYEQLDVTARDLEETNQKLVADSRASQQKILSLTETIECLQTNIDHLQGQVEELKASSPGPRPRPSPSEERAAPAFACLKELYDLRQHFVYDHVFAEQIASLPSAPRADEEENARLRRAAAALQAQLGAERRRRAALEEELGLALAENRELEQRLRGADACRARALELEAEVAEVRRRLRARPAGGGDGTGPEEPSQSLLEEILLGAPEPPRKPLKRSSSETALCGSGAADLVSGHEQTCIRRAKAVKQRGVSLLHEVDSQYSALKEKYEALLRRCQPEPDSLSHKAVQTSRAPTREPPAASSSPEPGAPERGDSLSPSTPPEYRALFKEIFSCIQKTKREIDEQRARYRPLSAQPGL
ncbi:cerebellar degeneration-related protein 2 [Perognathus longimembris pacificus]|uniref:cerebellar degeneration-related protein 2 n=1 Tax=Perognathus longimembris pacificus TaxID=214514 RepID=UPI0020187BC3|nr:cerebellar degeneration-related protein 2 [Perognathus longimembris pacificus]